MVEPRPSAPRQSNWLSAFARAALARPRATVCAALVLLGLCGIAAWDLPISTSRYALMADDHPLQARQLRFFDRFGYPDSLVFVVTGDDVEARRKSVDALSAKLEEDPALKGRVLSRVGLNQVAEVLLLVQPDALSETQKRLGGDQQLASVIEGGLPAWLESLQVQLDEGLYGDEEGTDPAANAEPNKGLAELATLMRALETRLAKGDALRDLPNLKSDSAPRGIEVDDAGYVVSGNGQFHLVAMFPELNSAEGEKLAPIVQRIRKLRDEAGIEPGVNADLTGLPALVSDELAVVKRGLAETSLATTAGILLLLFLAFRSIRYTSLTLLPLGVGIVLTLAFVRPTYGGLNLITASFVPVLLALGIDFGVYVLSRYGELTRAGAAPREAIVGAITHAGPGMVIGAVTTVLAFLMTTTVEFTAYAQLGVLTAVGLGLMLLVTLLLLPALLWLAGRGQTISSPQLPGVHKLPALVRRFRVVIIAVCAVALGLSTTCWTDLEFNARYFDFLPEDTESAIGLRQIEREKSVSPVMAGIPNDSVEEARATAAKLRTLPAVGAVQTATDVLPVLDNTKLAQLRAGLKSVGRKPDFDKLRTRKRSLKQLKQSARDLLDSVDGVALEMRRNGMNTEGADELKKATLALKNTIGSMTEDSVIADLEVEVANLLERAWTTADRVAQRGHYVPEDLPEILRARFTSKDGAGLAVYATPRGNIWNKAVAKDFHDQVSAAAPEASGMAMNLHEHIRMIREGFKRATLLSALLVVVVLLIGFRRLGDVVLAATPVLIGFGCMLGIMAILELNFDVANIVVLPVILGIGIDAGAHMVHRWRESAESNDGVARLEDLLEGTGAAVLLASLTTALGFSALMLGDYGAMKTLGLTMSIGIGCCLVETVLVLPSILALLKKAR